MLQNDFYSITALQNENGVIKAAIEINASHKIFEGHFPGQPVVPGVCMLQITKEIIESTLSYPLQLRKADFMKFLTVMDPTKNNLIDIELQYSMIEDDAVKLTASLFDNNATYFKFKGVFAKK